MSTAHLISSMGTSPSVLTEAIWWLEREKGLSVIGLTCVGTSTAHEKAESDLFAPGAALDRLRGALGKQPGWLGPGEVIWEVEPLESSDNRNREESLAMDRACYKAILKAQDGPADAVMACISGGRKTMSSSLQQAMTLLARDEDMAFHILLGIPEGIQESWVIESGWAFPGDGFPRLAGKEEKADILRTLEQHRSQVRLDGIEVPLVRLRLLVERAKLDPTRPELVEALRTSVAELSAPVHYELVLGDLKLWRIRDGQRVLLGDVNPRDALIWSAFIEHGSPMDQTEAALLIRNICEKVTEALPPMHAHPFSDDESIEEFIKYWENFKQASKIQTAMNKLGDRLRKLPIDTLHQDALRPKTPLQKGTNATSLQPYGFPDWVYRECLVRVVYP